MGHLLPSNVMAKKMQGFDINEVVDDVDQEAYVTMLQVLIVEEPSSEPKETKPANLVMLKTAASSLRDSIVQVRCHRQCQIKP